MGSQEEGADLHLRSGISSSSSPPAFCLPAPILWPCVSTLGRGVPHCKPTSLRKTTSWQWRVRGHSCIRADLPVHSLVHSTNIDALQCTKPCSRCGREWRTGSSRCLHGAYIGGGGTGGSETVAPPGVPPLAHWSMLLHAWERGLPITHSFVPAALVSAPGSESTDEGGPVPRALTPGTIHLCKRSTDLRGRSGLRRWFFALANGLEPLMRAFLASVSLSVRWGLGEALKE